MSSKKTIFSIILLCVLFGALHPDEFVWFSQNDKRWKQERIGSGRGSTISNSGCVLSCLAMLLNAEASNPRVTPDKLNRWLKQNRGYSGNLMRWEVPGYFDGSGIGLELVAKSKRSNDWQFLSSELAKGNKVIVKITDRRSHWVLVVKQEGPPNEASSYIVNDPGLDSFESRTLAHWGGFRSARSYSGNWLDEDAFDLSTDIEIEPVSSDEMFIYDIMGLPYPADVFVRISNNLAVPISGYFLLGLFDADDQFLRTIDHEYTSIEANGFVDLIYEFDDAKPVFNENASLRIIYSKHFSTVPSFNESIEITRSPLTSERLMAETEPPYVFSE